MNQFVYCISVIHKLSPKCFCNPQISQYFLPKHRETTSVIPTQNILLSAQCYLRDSYQTPLLSLLRKLRGSFPKPSAFLSGNGFIWSPVSFTLSLGFVSFLSCKELFCFPKQKIFLFVEFFLRKSKEVSYSEPGTKECYLISRLGKRM